jgi:RES domain-containing protein
MQVYRIQKAKYKNDISGYGTTLVAGPWHQSGRYPILYTSCNVSLAILECVVHLPPAVKPPELVLHTLEIPDAKVEITDEADLPINWNKKGYFDVVQQWGSTWLQSRKSLAILVPSVLSPDNNILINPNHPDFSSVVVIESRSITLNERLI